MDEPSCTDPRDHDRLMKRMMEEVKGRTLQEALEEWKGDVYTAPDHFYRKAKTAEELKQIHEKDVQRFHTLIRYSIVGGFVIPVLLYFGIPFGYVSPLYTYWFEKLFWLFAFAVPMSFTAILVGIATIYRNRQFKRYTQLLKNFE